VIQIRTFVVSCARDRPLIITDMSVVVLHKPQIIRNDDKIIAYDGYLLLFPMAKAVIPMQDDVTNWLRKEQMH